MEKRQLVIIGSGAAGLTAAIYAARANLSPMLIAGVLPGGLLTQTSDVENFPGFPEAVNGFELMFKFQQQAERFGTQILNETVNAVKLKNGGPQEISLSGGTTIEAAALIIATGSSPKWLGLDSEKKFMNRGVSACATCDGAFFRGVPVVVTGGGDTAMEEALFLTRFASKVYVVHRRDQLRASKIMADRAMNNPKIEFVWSSQIEEILGDSDVSAVRIKNLLNGEEKTIDCKGYFAALGHNPNTKVFQNSGLKMDEAGYIELEGASSLTNIAGVFAAGDCADHVYRQAITAAGMGARSAIDAARYLEGKE